MVSPVPSNTRDATFYHYTLIRKIGLRPESKYSYMLTALLVVSALYFIYGWLGLIYTVVGAVLTLLVHAFVLRLTVRRVDKLSEKRWTFRRDWPWIGPLPILDTHLSLFRRLHFHLFLVGCCVAGLFYPWAHSSLVISMVYWHLWLLTPRIRLLLSLRRERGDGVIRLESKEVSYYHQ
ncbi:transposase [Cohnella endophytica]|uniref:Transposase n=1 Tax=Cohnella endophytica TaxID=2419778 RepID=A0A494X454_9BACL|nr:transposase [Cohnella endophytica]RKP45475.1 transposase [Cohnella endophytica]